MVLAGLHATGAAAGDPVLALRSLVAAAPGQPFTLKAERAPSGALLLRWQVGAGTYLYRDSLEASLAGRPVPLERPAGESKDDPSFGVVQVFHGPVEARADAPERAGQLRVAFQGCSDAGICFPPQARLVDLATLQVRPVSDPGPVPAGATPATAFPATASPDTVSPDTALPATARPATATPAPDGVGELFRAGLGVTLGTFLGFGLLLALTPCVFPLLPILAGMLTRSGAGLTRGRGLALTGAYVLAMAGAYGLVGAVAGWSGANLQAMLQTPLALGVTAAIFVALALSMFGLFDLKVPAGLGARLAGRGAGQTLGGAALLGFGSALIVGPCVTPPLAGAMLYAAATGDAARGAAALFMLGLGMGLPLMLVGLFGPSLLPKGGPWLVRAKQMFGAVFLAVAILIAGRLLPPPATLALLGALLMGAAAAFGGFDRLTPASGAGARLACGGGMAAALYGATLIIGAAGGAEDPLRPLAFPQAPSPATTPAPAEARVASIAAFDAAVARAMAEVPGGRPILVDFTAGWCTVCASNAKVMAAPGVRERLAPLPRVIADVTAYGEATRALMERFQVAGPPTLFLMDAQGREIPGSRIVGPVTAEEIARRLDAAGA
ncbi:protein-disulfide reductase DsbD [Xanthobacter sp. AM11]|uniref:protein-disulfide reductase DsbD n=1 Tax=Xanthobacter sp. AM11 TaxID=3380643 RepID=UPI0039BF4197